MSHGAGDPPRQPPVGPALRRAWVGYQRRLDAAMAAAGFDDRRFPDGRVLRMCAGPGQTTTSQIGRELGISRQGASKVVAGLRERGYVSVTPSATNGREKIVEVTPRAIAYIAAQRKAARDIEAQLRTEVGAESFASLHRLLDALGSDGDMRLADYLRSRGVHEL